VATARPTSRPTSVEKPGRALADRIRRCAEIAGSGDALAQKAGIPRSTLETYLTGKAEPKALRIVAIARAADVSIEWLASGDGEERPAIQTPTMPAPVAKYGDASGRDGDFVMVPRYDVHGSAGTGELIHSEQVVDYLAFRADWVRNALGVAHKDLALISVKGDSMEPTLSNGDLILVDTGARRVEDSAIYVLKTGEGLFVKRLQHKLSGEVIVKSDNADKYEPEIYEPEAATHLSVVGRVVWAGRRL